MISCKSENGNPEKGNDGMIDNIDGNNKALEDAIKNAEQAKARLANERKKQNERRWKAEYRHKYMMGGIIVKYFPQCYRFEESELNQILSAALATQECRRVIGEIEQAAGRVAQGKVGSVDEAERKRVGSAATVGESPLSPVARL